MAKRQFFIAGTDTDVGKTVITAGILEKANQHGLRTIGLKPVAAGCELIDGQLRNSDALLIQETASVPLSYDEVNPVALTLAIAPHIAAEKEERKLSADRLAALCRGAMMHPADLLLIEGAGGWRVPLNRTETLAKVPVLLEVPVILVVGVKLGCINHALLSVEAIRRDGLPLAGWVANRIDGDMGEYEENVATLRSLLPAPLLGEVPRLADPSPATVAKFVEITGLLE